MRVLLDWLAEFVELQADADDLARRLTMAGLEVERIETSSLPTGVVLGRILDVRPHPTAERLSICRVDVGGSPLEIVCGAPGVAAGQLVATALPGAALPAGVVEERRVAGSPSGGVLCSERDLGLGEDHGGLLEITAADLSPSGSVSPLLPGTDLGTLIRPTVVLEISITPNRGDCCSVIGVAREVSALFGSKLRGGRRQGTPVAETEEDSFAVATEAHELCPWYCAQRASAPTAARSPFWMRHRLRSSGVRPISPAVDVTNYVMLERGQPLHAFDLDRLQGGRLIARRAKPGERLDLLDGSRRDLTPDDLVIADAREPVALAGIMGGSGSEVSVATRRLVLESALFAPSTVRRTARRLGLHSEASFRFERGVDPAGTAAAIARAGALLATLGGRPIGRLLEAGGPPAEPGAIAIVPKRVNALLGTTVEPQEMVRRLRSIGSTVRRTHGETIEVIPPSFRSDLRLPADLSEEIARIGGYDAIPTVVPRVAARGRVAAANGVRQIQNGFAARGFAETVLLAFSESGDNERFPGLWPAGHRSIELRNPLASVAREMRRSLLPGLIGALRVNQARGEEFVALFAVGTVFAQRSDGGTVENSDVAAVVWGSPPGQIGQPGAPVTFLDLKRIVEQLLEDLHVRALGWSPGPEVGFLHPGRSAEIRAADRIIGRMGAIHPGLAHGLDLRGGDLWLLEMDTRAVLDGVGPAPRYAEPARFPAVTRDVALVVDEQVLADQVVGGILRQRHPLVENATLFDEYRGPGVKEGRKSLAFTVSYRSPDRTLTDVEVNELHEDILRILADTVRFERRGTPS